MNIINSNPYRLLGIYSNSSIKERVTKRNKIKAYLKIGKSISFDTDLPHLIASPIRTVESIEQATYSLNNPRDQIKYALFWFIKASAMDKIALSYLQKGDVTKAKELLYDKIETFSSLLNTSILAFIQGEQALAIESITKLIHSECYRKKLVEAVCGSTFQIEEDDLAHLFIDELLKEMPAQKWHSIFRFNGFSQDDNNYLIEKAVEKPTAIIKDCINQAESIRNDDAPAQYLSGTLLINQTKNPLVSVKRLLGTSDIRYQMLVDNLTKQILQCSINYYNNSHENEREKIGKALCLQMYAQSIAEGKLIKERCQKNENILKKKQANLPPKIIETEVQKIIEELVYYNKKNNNQITEHSSTFRNQNNITSNKYDVSDKIYTATALLNNTSPYLISIKEKLGSINTSYLKWSTQVIANALTNVIEEVNNASFKYQKTKDLEKLKSTLESAWKAIKIMDTFDIETEFKLKHYNTNRNTLKKLCEQFNINMYSNLYRIIALITLIAILTGFLLFIYNT